MRKQWIYGGIAAAVLASGAAVAVFASKGGDAPKKPEGEKAQVALEFVPSEVTSPALASMPALIEFFFVKLSFDFSPSDIHFHPLKPHPSRLR